MSVIAPLEVGLFAVAVAFSSPLFVAVVVAATAAFCALLLWTRAGGAS